VQLLELVLTQPPAGARQRDRLLAHWLASAAGAGRRLPHALLPSVLDLATSDRALRAPTVAVLDARGTWLAAQRADWSWVAEVRRGVGGATDASTPAADDWARLPSAERVGALTRARLHDTDAGRALLESTWGADSAKDRRAHLETLRIGLGPADEPLLERALDDRAASVREVALDLLDGLPGSARAQRLAARLRPLVRATGLLKRGLEVALPDEPDEPDHAAVRDGLGDPPKGRSRRGWWLERLAAGAPLDVWTTVSGADPATTLARLSDDDALNGIRRAARIRRDSTWAAAFLQRGWDPDLVEALPRVQREDAVLAHLTATPTSGIRALGLVATPWSLAFSVGVLARLRSVKPAAPVVGGALPDLVDGLHPDSVGAVEQWLDDARDDPALSTHLRHLIQFHSVHRAITEAFT
ncbi:hypothetical protein N865_20640, partial [Intrasporangium oryzae NRRL B-24470]